MRVDFLSIFPGLVDGVLEYGLLNHGRQKGLLDIHVHDLRQFTHDRHRSVDDVPYGGGPGMVFKPEPIFEAVETIGDPQAVILLPSPQGELFQQKIAEDLAKATHLIFICGRYEGVDERVREMLVDRELSIGDFVTMGGELPSLLMLEAIVRFVPGVVGRQESVAMDSFQHSLLDFPQYTRPEEYKGKKVPAVLLSGHHEQIRRWRRKMALIRTRERRADLLERVSLSEEDRELLAEWEREQETDQIKVSK
ncbi:MAG TPA: tRNA (guanosine(37)-N1)-methyltransferase TrmD [Acidobacteriota bacterium]